MAESRERARRVFRRDRYQGPAAQSRARQEILPAVPPPLVVSSFSPTMFPTTSGFLAAFRGFSRSADVQINGEVRCLVSLFVLQFVSVQVEAPVAHLFSKKTRSFFFEKKEAAAVYTSHV